MPFEMYYFAGSYLKKCFAGILKCWVVSAKKERCVHTSGAKSLETFDDAKLYMSSIWKGESCTTECAMV
jgi:hypothetical protein